MLDESLTDEPRLSIPTMLISPLLHPKKAENSLIEPEFERVDLHEEGFNICDILSYPRLIIRQYPPCEFLCRQRACPKNSELI
jgi:hypothetical protein